MYSPSGAETKSTMAIYYTTVLRTRGWVVRALDTSKKDGPKEVGRAYPDPSDANHEFKIQHPKAEFLEMDFFRAKVTAYNREKKRLNAWNKLSTKPPPTKEE